MNRPIKGDSNGAATGGPRQKFPRIRPMVHTRRPHCPLVKYSRYPPPSDHAGQLPLVARSPLPARCGAGFLPRSAHRVGLLAIVVALAACATLDGPDYGTYDENEGFNRASYDFSEVVDRRALAPVARGYKTITPDAVETGIGNFFANLRSLDSSLNGFLQGKPGRGATDAMRFLLNSTVGIGGLFDVATGAGLVDQEEDIGQTLAVWGWRNSRYVYVPLVGPSTIRDLPSLVMRALVPRLVLGGAADLGLSSAGSLGLSALNIVSARADVLTLTDARDSTALDAYVFTREAYVQRRKFLIFDGDPPVEEFDAFFGEFDDFDEEP